MSAVQARPWRQPRHTSALLFLGCSQNFQAPRPYSVPLPSGSGPGTRGLAGPSVMGWPALCPSALWRCQDPGPVALATRAPSVPENHLAGRMAQTPDGISCELRGKRWSFSPTWLGGSRAAPVPTGGPPRVLGHPASGSLWSSGGLGGPDPLHCFLAGPLDEPRPPSPIQTTDHGHELTSMAGTISQQAALPQARSPSSCGPRRQNCC